ncbi:hypothetical protein B0H13DRAFT_1921232, partial [Mycena leptocephala]
TSVDTERLFSFSGGTISKLRNQLSEKSAHSAVMVGQWASDPDLIAVDEFESQLAEGWTRKKKRRVPNAAEAQGSSKCPGIIHHRSPGRHPGWGNSISWHKLKIRVWVASRPWKPGQRKENQQGWTKATKFTPSPESETRRINQE